MLIMTSKHGRLGNRLFSFAYLIRFALERGLTVCNPAFDEYAPYFEGTRHDLLCRFPAGRMVGARSAALRRALYLVVSQVDGRLPRRELRMGQRIIASEFDALMSEAWSHGPIPSTAKKGLVRVRDWHFWDRCGGSDFGDHAATIRAFFTPIAKHRQGADDVLSGARTCGCKVLVGMHVRQGDYQAFEGGRYLYSIDDYTAAMEQVAVLQGTDAIGFLVCSDAQNLNLPSNGLRCFRTPGHLVEDLLVLSRCDLIVGPPSTYSMWASFWGQAPLCTLWSRGQMIREEHFRVCQGIVDREVP